MDASFDRDWGKIFDIDLSDIYSLLTVCSLVVIFSSLLACFPRILSARLKVKMHGILPQGAEHVNIRAWITGHMANKGSTGMLSIQDLTLPEL